MQLLSDHKSPSIFRTPFSQTEGQVVIEGDPQCLGSAKINHTFELAAEALTVRISHDKEYCAVGLTNGVIKLFPMPHKLEKSKEIELIAPDEKLPCTDLEFVPKQGDRKKLVGVYASGLVRLWYYNFTGKMSLLKSWKENESRPNKEDDTGTELNQVMCISVSADGKRFITGGSDTVVRAYDSHSDAPGRLLIPSIRTDSTVAHNFHTNRVTALLYHPRGGKDASFAHMFVSSSWDGTVQGWDDRVCGSLWQHAGTYVAGADGLCIDQMRNFVITASFKHDKVLSQVWEANFSNNPDVQRPVATVSKPLSTISQDAGSPPVQVYVTRMTSDNQCLLFGGTNGAFFKLLNAITLRPIASVSNLATGVYSADSCVDPSDKKRFVVAFTSGTKVYLLLIDPRVPSLADSH